MKKLMTAVLLAVFGVGMAGMAGCETDAQTGAPIAAPAAAPPSDPSSAPV
jgi:hypothetical protein